ncbi:MAG: LacI family DNA-binding transcriptional regulator [Ardenticatenaceae bacterium]|nr:LacI family DNA-binding transcriptional regulator [Ardenticatenaceae bacterium]
MTEKSVTSIDVAQLAGVSQPTVSRAFDPNGRIAPETRERVMAAARALGYQPNVIARGLSTQRTDIVGIVMGNLTRSFFYPKVLENLTQQLQALGKQVLLFNAPADRPVDELLPRVLGYQVDALVIASTTPGREIIDHCARKGTPVVLFNRQVPDSPAYAVCCDNEDGGRRAADALIDAGYTRLALLSGIQSTATNTLREKGFVEQVLARGLPEPLRERGDFSYESGRTAARRLLERHDRPDGVFCAADAMALGLMDAARFELAMQIPADLGIVGFDDIPAAAWPAYSLTTIRQPVEMMVNQVVELIVPDPDPDEEEDTVEQPTGRLALLPCQLMQRGSVRPVPKGQSNE